MTMMREIRGVMAGRLALMTLIVAQQEPLMKVLPWKSKIPDCSSYISPPAVLKPIHFSLPRLNHRINRALGKFETLTTTTFYRLTTAANDLFFLKWKQIEPEFIPLCERLQWSIPCGFGKIDPPMGSNGAIFGNVRPGTFCFCYWFLTMF